MFWWVIIMNTSIPKLDSTDTDLIAQIAREFYVGEPPTTVPDSGTLTPPPVHPRPETKTPSSGGHSPESGDSYAFGEPRCNGRSRYTRSGETRRAESRASEDFYFLRGHAPAVFDVESVRSDFPALQQDVNGHPLIWLDNAATTQKPKSVIDAVANFYSHDYSNIHRGAHTLAARATELYEAGREKVQRFIGAKESREIVFVRGTTEAINLLAQTYGRKFIGPGDEILLTTMEHHANIVPWQLLAEQTGAVIRVAPINDAGELLLDQFAALLTPRTKIVAVTQVANALGTVNPIEQIIAIAHSFGVPVLVDGAQSTPHMPVNVQALDADFFVFSGHKIFGPTGIGVLYGKAQWLEQLPPYHGGGNMIRDVTFAKTTYQGIPQKFEAGTPSIAGVVGLGAAIDYLTRLGLPAIAAYEHQLLDYATAALATVPGLRPIGTAAAKASVLSFVLKDVPTETVGRHLDKYGIAVRSGHHCAQPALRRLGVETTVRPSLALYNTFHEIDELVRVLHLIEKQP